VGDSARSRTPDPRFQSQSPEQFRSDPGSDPGNSRLDSESGQWGEPVRPRDQNLAQQLEARLLSFSRSRRSLPGIRAAAKRKVLLEQLVESIRRVRFVAVLRTR